MKPLFVYGTLQPGRENEQLLTRIGGEWCPATVRGTYYAKAWGLAADFPGLIVDEQGDEVPGYLFYSDALTEHWPELDVFEAGYDRITAIALSSTGERLEAWVYQVQPFTSNQG